RHPCCFECLHRLVLERFERHHLAAESAFLALESIPLAREDSMTGLGIREVRAPVLQRFNRRSAEMDDAPLSAASLALSHGDGSIDQIDLLPPQQAELLRAQAC